MKFKIQLISVDHVYVRAVTYGYTSLSLHCSGCQFRIFYLGRFRLDEIWPRATIAKQIASTAELNQIAMHCESEQALRTLGCWGGWCFWCTVIHRCSTTFPIVKDRSICFLFWHFWKKHQHCTVAIFISRVIYLFPQIGTGKYCIFSTRTNVCCFMFHTSMFGMLFILENGFQILILNFAWSFN